MFYKAIRFNQPLNSWRTGSVVQMSSVFGGTKAFNQPLDSWQTESAKLVAAMFASSEKFNQPLDSWKTGSVTDITAMFSNTAVFDQNIGSWQVGAVAVEEMARMFHGTAGLSDCNKVKIASSPAWSKSAAFKAAGYAAAWAPLVCAPPTATPAAVVDITATTASTAPAALTTTATAAASTPIITAPPPRTQNHTGIPAATSAVPALMAAPTNATATTTPPAAPARDATTAATATTQSSGAGDTDGGLLAAAILGWVAALGACVLLLVRERQRSRQAAQELRRKTLSAAGFANPTYETTEMVANPLHRSNSTAGPGIAPDHADPQDSTRAATDQTHSGYAGVPTSANAAPAAGEPYSNSAEEATLRARARACVCVCMCTRVRETSATSGPPIFCAAAAACDWAARGRSPSLI